MSVSAWLKLQGLEKYAQAFTDNDVDMSVLRLLGEQDLERLGVSLGHRKLLMRAIAELDAGPASAPSVARKSDSGERRPLTVMFCDMVSFTELARRVDPETLQGIVEVYERVCGECIAKYEGRIFQRVGDGIVAFFGYPVAHEDEAERAVRAGLDIVARLARLELPELRHIAVRIGIASGLVVVQSEMASAAGDTMAIAARLQSLAEPDTVIVTGRVHRALHSRFDCTDRGEHLLKGVAQLVRVWQVRGDRRLPRRFLAAHATSLTPLLGRETELAALHTHWGEVLHGRGQVLAIGGEAGIGKSRLVQQLIDELHESPGAWLADLQCSPFHADSALHPVAEQLRLHIFGDAPIDEAQRWGVLEKFLRATSLPFDTAAPLFAHLLSVTPPSEAPLGMTSGRQQVLLRKFLTQLMVDRASRGPGVIFIEDLHWADPSTLDLIDHFVAHMREARVLLLLTHRPSLARALPALDHVHRLLLDRLSGADAASLARAVFAGEDAGYEVLRQVLDKTDGVPLYIEEFARAVVHSRKAAVSSALARVQIPESLQDSLMSRLDRLGEAKVVAQLAAMLGREFRRDVLEAVWAGDPEDLAAGLAHLIEAEFIYAAGDAPVQRYVFKHALIQDAAYEALLKSHRATYHRRTAEVLEQRFPALVEDQPEIVAQHYSRAGKPDLAAQLWLRAGQLSLTRNGHVEAAAHLRSALAAIGEMPESEAKALAELDVHIALGTALVAARGYASPDVEIAWRRAQQLCAVVGHAPQLVPAMFGLWMFETVRGNHPAALALSEDIVRMAEGLQSDDLVIEARLGMAISRFFLGDFAAACESFDIVLATYDAARHGGHRFQFGQDPAAIAWIYLAWIHWLQGDGERADAVMAQASAFARGLDHPFTLSFVLAFDGWLRQYTGEGVRARALAEELVQLCTEEQIPVFLAHGLVLVGWCACNEGTPRGPMDVAAALEVFKATGSRCFLPYWHAFLADVLSQRGRHDEAAALLAEALAAMEASQERWAEPEIHRLNALALQRRGADPAAVRDAFERALASARARGMHAWEARAIRSLAALPPDIAFPLSEGFAR
ncbi:AAA family ATPase [Niveibacterium sp. SC-1]|uniref:AAA family ATPase n=1 Tax=Niveibacterium sp. SC-1 TaxID=3135646 RepID=UPI00311D4484